MIRTIEISPAIISSTLARYLLKDFTIQRNSVALGKDELRDYIRTMLEANQEKEFFDGQAPENSY